MVGARDFHRWADSDGAFRARWMGVGRLCKQFRKSPIWVGERVAREVAKDNRSGYLLCDGSLARRAHAPTNVPRSSWPDLQRTTTVASVAEGLSRAIP